MIRHWILYATYNQIGWTKSTTVSILMYHKLKVRVWLINREINKMNRQLNIWEEEYANLTQKVQREIWGEN